MSFRKADPRTAGSIRVRLISLGLLVVGWWAFAVALADPEILPSPLEIARLTARELFNGPLLYNLGVTLGRVVAAFILAMAIGTVAGLVMQALSNSRSIWQTYNPLPRPEYAQCSNIF